MVVDEAAASVAPRNGEKEARGIKCCDVREDAGGVYTRTVNTASQMHGGLVCIVARLSRDVFVSTVSLPTATTAGAQAATFRATMRIAVCGAAPDAASCISPTHRCALEQRLSHPVLHPATPTTQTGACLQWAASAPSSATLWALRWCAVGFPCEGTILEYGRPVMMHGRRA